MDKTNSLKRNKVYCLPVKCLIVASFLVPVSAKISAAVIPCKSSAVCVSCTGFPACVRGSACAAVVVESVRREAAKEGMLVDAASLGEARASWRRSSVVAILAGGGGVLEVGFETVHVVVVVVGCKRITLIRSLGDASFGRSFPRTTFCARPSMIDALALRHRTVPGWS